MKKAAALSICATICVTVLSCFPIQQFYLVGVEIIVLMLISYYLFAAQLRMCLFLTFFYEITIALWEFIISAGLGIAFRSDRFLNTKSLGFIMAVWIVRFLMLGIIIAVKAQKSEKKRASRIINVIGVTGFLGIVLLSGQNTNDIGDDQLTTWLIFSVLILMAIMVFSLDRQYEMEKTIAQFEKEKNALLERDYQTLNNTYAANAKLYHDFHNHLETLHRYLADGNSEEALHYIDDIRSPLQTITQTVWTGDKAIDYLINSKITIAETDHIQVKANIEFPRHTNIRSADLVAILGNLIDNALEAAVNAEDNLRFINLTIRRINDMLIVKVENGCKNAPKQAGGKFLTTKDDQSFHGWGLKSVQSAAERYDGTVVTEYENNIFKVVVTLSYEAVKIDN